MRIDKNEVVVQNKCCVDVEVCKMCAHEKRVFFIEGKRRDFYGYVAVCIRECFLLCNQRECLLKVRQNDVS